MWDKRYVKNGADCSAWQSYTGHQCSNYNINAAFCNDDSSIITGSENGKIFIFNTLSAEVEQEFRCESDIVHIVEPGPECIQSPCFVSSTTDSELITFWGPIPKSGEEEVEEAPRGVSYLTFEDCNLHFVLITGRYVDRRSSSCDGGSHEQIR
jgi:hypothetical protein